MKPLLNEEEFAKTTALVKEFGTNPNLGPKLQSLLEEKAAQKDNWVFETYSLSTYLLVLEFIFKLFYTPIKAFRLVAVGSISRI